MSFDRFGVENGSEKIVDTFRSFIDVVHTIGKIIIMREHPIECLHKQNTN